MDTTVGVNSMRVTAYVFTMVALLSAINITCRQSSLSPSETAKAYINYLAEGKIDDAAKLVSSNFANKRGAYGTNLYLADVAAGYALSKKNNQGKPMTITIVREDIVGDLAEVSVKMSYGDQGAYSGIYKFIKDKGLWKFDGIDSGINRQP